MPLPEKVEAITHLKKPKTIKGLQGFVGMINFYRRFIPVAARTMTPLFEALTGKPKPLVCFAVMMKAFHDTKKSLPMQHHSRILVRTHRYYSLRTPET